MTALYKHPLYHTWSAMKDRCHNPRNPGYANYGGRGIRVCARWRKSFAAFLADMGERPSAKHSLDRHPDNDGDYKPGNCRWATKKQQASNTRVNNLVTINGRTQTATAWAEEYGLRPALIIQRLFRGMTGERLLAKRTPNSQRTHCPYGHKYTPGNTDRDSKGSRICRTCRHSRPLYGKRKRERALKSDQPSLTSDETR